MTQPRFLTLSCVLIALSHVARADVLADAPGVELVERHCTSCHSARLVAQNHATRSGWERLIRRMQSSQGLWPLGADESAILNYLSTNYGPLDDARRPALAGSLLPSANPDSKNN